MTIYTVNEKTYDFDFDAKVIGVFLEHKDALKLQKERVIYWEKYIVAEECEPRIIYDENIVVIDSEPIWTSLEIQKFEIEDDCKNIYTINEKVYDGGFKATIVNVFSDKEKAINLASERTTYWFDLALRNNENPEIRGENSDYQVVSADVLWTCLEITEEIVK